MCCRRSDRKENLTDISDTYLQKGKPSCEFREGFTISVLEVKRLKITWLGHACFRIESNGSSLVIDPYNWKDIPGMKPYQTEADAVYCTHEHHDHNYREAVILTGKTCTLSVETIGAFHDDRQGALRGTMILYIISDGVFRAAHFGDLGHMLSEEQFQQIGHLDALMVNVGGFEASEAEFANSIVNKIRPNFILPFHFRGEGFGFPNSGTLEEFTCLRNDSLMMEGNEIELQKTEGTHTVIFQL